jgi:TolB-like protein
MKNNLFCIIPVIMLVTGCAGSAKPAESSVDSSSGITLDAALKEAAARIDERVAAWSKIAPLNFNSPHDKFSGYVLDELTANLVDSGKLTVVDRKEVDLIRGEFDFQFSGEVGDDSMQELGRMLGAQSIISGSLTDMGGFQRIVIRVLNVQSASVAVQYRANIVSDSIVAALLTGGKTTATAGTPQRASSGSSGGTAAASVPSAQAPAAVLVQAEPAPAPAAPAPAPVPAVFTPTYKIGDKGPGGGIVFYINTAGFTLTADGTTCHYLEAAPADLGKMAWASSDAKSTNIAGLVAAVGAGKRNTDLILAADPNSPAANACKDYSGGGKSDWFLPSISELAQLYHNREVVGGFTVSNGYDALYWSSAQNNKEQALCLFLKPNGSEQFIEGKNVGARVRPIRAF